MSRKLKEIKNKLDLQIQDTISSAITEKILPSIQNTLETQGRAYYPTVDRDEASFTMADRRSSELQRNAEVDNGHKLW